MGRRLNLSKASLVSLLLLLLLLLLLPDDVGDVWVWLLTAAVASDVVVRAERLQAELSVLLVVGHVARPGDVGMVQIKLTLCTNHHHHSHHTISLTA